MGSWNGTCMISRLPIQSGDKIKLVFLHPGYNKIFPSGGYCYANGVMNVAFLPISGEYDDYGGIENIERDANVSLIEMYFGRKYKKIKVEDKEILSKDNRFDIADIINGIERSDIQVFSEGDVERKKMAQNALEVYSKNGFSSEKIERQWKELADMDVSEQWRPLQMSFVMIRQDVWDKIVENHNPNTWDKIPYKKRLIQQLDKAKAQDREALGEILELGYAGGNNFMESERYFQLLANKKGHDLFRNLWYEFKLVRSFIEGSRIGWMVQQGKGSQSNEWELYKVLSNIVNEICDEKLKSGE